jgi:mono/diheme cytochrome c family protein
MTDQPRYDPLEPGPAFDGGMSARTPVSGTIARGQLQLDDAFFTGKVNGELVSELPDRALEGRSMAELLSRGQERFTIFCSHCHGQVGGGIGGAPEMESLVGMVVQRGFPAPPTYHQDRLRQVPIGHFFEVISDGFGRMPAHRSMIPPEDRWAIAMYIRALQLSQHAPSQQLTPVDLQQLTGQSAAPPNDELNPIP